MKLTFHFQSSPDDRPANCTSSVNLDNAEPAVVDGVVDLESASVDDLARLAKSGDVEAFASLATRLRPRLLVVLARRLGGHIADAEDVVQDALAKAWSSIQAYDSGRSFKAWVYTIAIRRATDCLRGRNRRLRHNQRSAVPVETHDSVQQTMIDREATANIWSTAKRELSGPQYVALWLRYAEELSVSEVAESMGKSKVATRVLLHRGRAKLHSHLAAKGWFHET